MLGLALMGCGGGGGGIVQGGFMPCMGPLTQTSDFTVTITFDDATIGATAVQLGIEGAMGGQGYLPDRIPHTPGQKTMTVDKGVPLMAGDHLAVQALNGDTPIGNGYSQPITRTTCAPVAISVTAQVTTDFATTTTNNQLDVLFVIEDPPSMAASIDKAIAGFPAFADALRHLPGGMPSLHLGVVSADTGPGKFDLPAYRCPFGGDHGQFKSAPEAPCTTAPLSGNDTFLSVSNNETTQNFTGKIEDAFACIARLPATGCGFDGPLKALRWALDPFNPPGSNAGFLRLDAALLVVVVANHDDCSVPDDSDLFDPSQTLLADPLGPYSTFRCNEFGHLCLIDGVMQPPPRGAATNLMNCVSNETPTGKLTLVGDEVAFLLGLKTDPTRIWVATIAGPPTPYSITTAPATVTGRSGGATTENDPQMIPSCMQSATEQAEPAVRLQQWAEAFDAHGIAQGICATSLQSELGSIGTTIDRAFLNCFAADLRDANPGTPELEPSCSAVEFFSDAEFHSTTKALPECTSTTSGTACWQIAPDAACGTHDLFTVQRPPGDPRPYLTEVKCDVCPAGAALPGCP